MNETISITKSDVRLVMEEWLDQPGVDCSDLGDLDECVEYLFSSLQQLSEVED